MPQIPQLQIPQMGAVSGGVDFAPLGQLGQIYQKAQQDAANKQAIAAFQQTGDTRALLGSGDMNLARLGQSLQQHADTLRQQGVENKRADANLGINQQNALINQARAKREAADFENTPDQYVKNPDGTYTDQYASIKAGTELANRKKLAAELGYEPGSTGYKAVISSGEDPSVTTPSLSDTSLDIKARQVAGGDLSALTNIGRGAQGSKTLEAIHNRAAEILINEKGMTREQAAAHLSDKLKTFKAETIYGNTEARTGAGREANLNIILKAADAAIPAALEASEKVARTGWVPLNRIIQKGEIATSDPNLIQFGMANLQLAEHWARAMNPTGVMRESDRDKALEFLSTTTDPKTYKAAVEQLKTQITRERDAIRSASGHGGGSATTPPPAKSAPMKWDDWLRSGNK
jgi:hypothetical protein